MDDTFVSHVQLSTLTHVAWEKLIILYEYKYAITKMCLRNKFQTLKMCENESVTKHIHIFMSLLEELFAIASLVTNEDDVFSLMKHMPINYRTYISSLRRQPNLTFQSLITNLV